MYAIASESGRGASGIGKQSERTWFVGGDGDVDQKYRPQSDVGDATLGTQSIGGSESKRKVVFGLADGRMLSPDLAPGKQGLDAVVYPGGFAVEVGPAGRLADPDEVLFFDTRGQRIGRVETKGSLAADARDLPMIVTPQGTTVYTPRGGPLVRISSDGAEPDTLLIGTRLMVSMGGGSFPEWTQYDLRTGRQGPTCKANFSNYLGNDGTVAVLRILDPAGGRVAKAVDPATCQTLWTLQAGANSQAQVWRINTTLVQLSDDGTELMSLVAPG